MNFDLSIHALNLLNLTEFHSILPEPLFSPIPNISDLFHGLNSLDVHISIVLNWLVASLFELEYGIIGELFAMQFSISFGPGEFSGIVFGLEMLMALGPAELEHFTIIAHESHAVARVDWARAKVTFVDSHFNNSIDKFIIFTRILFLI